MPASTTARFEKRKQSLSTIFYKDNMVSVWRNIVRSQLRNQDIKDLNDHYDFNYNIKEISEQIIFDVLHGKYKPDSPLVYKIEKKYGICRHLTIPSPNDSLVLQTIVEFISPLLKDKSPSTKAYYSRDKHQLKLPHEIQTAEDYPWFALWKKFQKEIFNFSKTFDWLVVTDLANYYDNIDLQELRSVVLDRLKVDEAVLDFLFNLIEQLMWTPDYLPKRKRGLPTINQECVRLLAHVFLFEVDEVLKLRTNDCFVRWMDDINFGVTNKQSGIKFLSEINDVLKSRGLALNISKTEIYSSKDARNHFLFKENMWLNGVKIIKRGARFYREKTLELERHFINHKKNEKLKNWDKVTKRYFTIASQFKTRRFLKYIEVLFQDKPGLRTNILKYLLSLGPKNEHLEKFLNLLKNIKSYDDITIFKIVNTVTTLEIQRTETNLKTIQKFDKILSIFNNKFDFYCYLWFCTKYSEEHKLLTTIVNNKGLWLNDSFLCRQVAASLSRVSLFNPNKYEELCHSIISTGIKGATSVILNQKELGTLNALNHTLRSYLIPAKKQAYYPLPKFLILLNVLRSEKIVNNSKVINDFKHRINDPWFMYLFQKRVNKI